MLPVSGSALRPPSQSREETQLALDLAQQGLRGCILGSDKIRSRRVQRELPSESWAHSSISRSERELKKRLHEQLAFETLLADLSAMFINLPANQVDGKIEEAQKRICEALSLDRSMLGQVSPKLGQLDITHSWRAEGLQDNLQVTPQDFPWSDRTVLGGKAISFARVDELPPEAAKDKEAFRRQGPKSAVMLPLYDGGASHRDASLRNVARRTRWPRDWWNGSV